MPNYDDYKLKRAVYHGSIVVLYGIPFDKGFLGHKCAPSTTRIYNEGSNPSVAKYGYHPDGYPPTLDLLVPNIVSDHIYTISDKRDWVTFFNKAATAGQKMVASEDKEAILGLNRYLISRYVISVEIIGTDITKLGRPDSEIHDYKIVGNLSSAGTFAPMVIEQQKRNSSHYPTISAHDAETTKKEKDEAKGSGSPPTTDNSEQLIDIPGGKCEGAGIFKGLI